jgi:hypothetical protein
MPSSAGQADAVTQDGRPSRAPIGSGSVPEIIVDSAA